MKLKFFVQNEDLESFEEEINEWIKDMEKKGGNLKDVTFRIGDYGLSVILVYEEGKK